LYVQFPTTSAVPESGEVEQEQTETAADDARSPRKNILRRRHIKVNLIA
jgi:hypothetical protein